LLLKLFSKELRGAVNAVLIFLKLKGRVFFCKITVVFTEINMERTPAKILQENKHKRDDN